MEVNLEVVILNKLIHDDEYMRQVIPYLDETLFSTEHFRTAYSLIKEFIDRYNKCPSVAALKIEIEDKDNLNAKTAEETFNLISSLTEPQIVDSKWLVDSTEKFVQNRALYLAINKAISIYNGSDKKLTPSAIPQLLTDALAISFNPNVGHDFLESAEERYAYYHTETAHIPFDIDLLNTITKGGVIRKTLNVLMAATGGGKSLAMCHMAAANFMQGQNVLYITLEMSEEEIAKRIDANLLDVTMDELMSMPQQEYGRRLLRIKSRTTGRLIIKEYPTSTANVNHFRALLNELRLKKNFVPDVIFIDYINICTSSRVRLGSGVNSYGYVKAIAEELRGLAVEYNAALWTATQTNRDGIDSSDLSMSDISESVGLPFTTDLFLALVSSDEMIQLNQMLIIQLKNRYNSLHYWKRFIVGCDRDKMQLYNCEQNAQDDVLKEDVPIMDNTEFGEQDEIRMMPSRKGKRNMKGFS